MSASVCAMPDAPPGQVKFGTCKPIFMYPLVCYIAMRRKLLLVKHKSEGTYILERTLIYDSTHLQPEAHLRPFSRVCQTTARAVQPSRPTWPHQDRIDLPANRSPAESHCRAYL